jgi:acetyl esterase/lipase
MGWPRDYALVGAVARVSAPPLTPEDLLGMVDPARLASENADLQARPFRGVIVACPYLPDLDPTSAADVGAYARFVTDVLLPRVRRETPALATAEATGIDGVSLGGVTALRVGFLRPDVFGAVGGIQPAIREEQAAEWTDLARAVLARRPGMKLRLLTSHDDYFRQAIVRTSEAWRAAGIPHEFAEVPGPHDYDFNRGPGSIELLLWNDRALAHA